MNERFNSFNGEVDNQRISFIEPAELYQPEPNACVSCVTANVMYMFGKMEQPDIATIDRELGREPGQPLVFNTAYLYLLRQGFTMHFIDTFDEEAFIDRGLPYLREFYKTATWAGPPFDQYWTPEKVLERQQARKVSRDEFLAYGSGFESEAKKPSTEDIDTLLDKNQVVLITVRGSGVGHATLVHGRVDDGTYKLYQPRKATADPYNITCFSAAKSYIDRELLPDEGIVGISLK